MFYISRTILIIICLSTCVNTIQSQTAFNNIYPILGNISQGNALYVHNKDSILVVGSGNDTIPYNGYDVSYSIFDLDGNLLFSKFYGDTISGFQFLDHNNNIFVQDNFLYFAPSYRNGWYVWEIEIKSGEVKRKIDFTPPFVRDDSLPYCCHELALYGRDKLAITTSIVKKNEDFTSNHFTLLDLKTESYQYSNFKYDNYNSGHLEIISNDKGFLLGGRSNYYPASHKHSIYRSSIVQLNHQGEVIWKYRSPEGLFRNRVHSLYEDVDRNVLFSSLIGIEEKGVFGDYYYFWRPLISMIDSNQNLVWECPLSFDIYGLDGYFTANNLLPALDGSGYVVAGHFVNLEKDTELDSLGLNPNGYPPIHLAYMTKVSPQGDSLYTRIYHHVSPGNNDNRIWDFEYSTDGGYLISGEVRDEDTPTFVETWLLKLDQYGCLVPDCHLTDDTTATDDQEYEASIKFQIYPNPTQELLYIYQSINQEIHYMIFNESGSMLHQFKGQFSGETMVLDVNIILQVYIISQLYTKMVVEKQSSL